MPDPLDSSDDTLLNVAPILPPSVVTAPMMTTAISDASSAYSMDVTARLCAVKRRAALRKSMDIMRLSLARAGCNNMLIVSAGAAMGAMQCTHKFP